MKMATRTNMTHTGAAHTKTSYVKTRNITITAIFAALITIMTAYVCHIPIPITGGYIHFGDSLIYIAASILPAPYAMLAAAIGGGLADLMTAPMWTLPTLIIKALITIPFANKGNKILTKRNIVAPILAYFISGTGYFLANNMVFHSGVAFLSSFAGSAIQSFGSMALYLIFGAMLDKMGFKKRMNF